MSLKKIYSNLPKSIKTKIDKLSFNFSHNIEEDFIFNTEIGKNYNLNTNEKKRIAQHLKHSISNIDSATDINIHFLLLKTVLALNPKRPSTIVECGVFKGATSVVLSIGAKITGRKLILYDSFEGLPDGEKNISHRYYPHLGVTGSYKKGMYKGALEEVKSNLLAYGHLDVCELRKGFFNKSLKKHKEKIDFLFLDVDLVSSTKDCILYLWDHLIDGCYCYTDDACDIDVVKVWFDDTWWKKNLKVKAPGYIGSGCGLPITSNFSSLGYTVKSPNLKKYKSISWLEKK